MKKYIHTKLDSGLQVIRVPMPEVKSVTVLALANTGSRFEEPAEQGIAHFFEHIVFKGTENYPDAQTLASAIDAIGADFNAFTSKEYTGYYVKSASRDMETSLDVVSDMMLAPKIRDEDIEREKGVIIEEINMYKDTPMHQIANIFENVVYAGSGLEHDILGTKETVSNIDSKKFRAFLKKWYGLENLIVIVAGDGTLLSEDSTLKTIETYFSKKAGEREQGRKDTKALSADEPKISDTKLHVHYKKTEQAHFIIGWPGIARDDKRKYALTLLSTALGSNMSSRLFTEVREQRGLCYYVHSDTDFYHNTGLLGASAGVAPSRVEEAISVVLEEFYQIADGSRPITAEELKKAKDYIAGTMTLSMEDSKRVAQYFGMKQLLSQEIETPEEVLEKFAAVTLAEVNQVAKDLIVPGEARLALIGPYKDQEKFEKLLK